MSAFRGNVLQNSADEWSTPKSGQYQNLKRRFRESKFPIQGLIQKIVLRARAQNIAEIQTEVDEYCDAPFLLARLRPCRAWQRGPNRNSFDEIASPQGGMSKRILVVEDQPDNRQIIGDMLAHTDYEITEAENGEAAARSHPYGYRPRAPYGLRPFVFTV